MPERERGEVLEGRCTCGHVRYRVSARPMFVHCCHCRWCQRETGSAFALNALVESDRVVVLPEGVPSVPGYYSLKEYWPPESIERLQAVKNKP
jgi:hypothetical protein